MADFSSLAERRTRRRTWGVAVSVAIFALASGCGSTTNDQATGEAAPSQIATTTTAESTAQETSTSTSTSTSAPALSSPSIPTEPEGYGPEVADPAEGPPSIDQLVARGTPLNLAHAGGDQSWPHSTAYAFSESVNAGADLLELDVRLTGDGVLVVHHDETVDRTTEIEGVVSDLTLAELQALDNGYWFRPGCWACQDNDSTDYPLRGVRTGDQAPPAGYTADDFRIETFAAIATRFSDMALDVEIKGELPGARRTAEVLAKEIRELGREDSVIVVAFDDDIVDAFTEFAPEVEVSPGTDRLTTWFLSGEPLDERFRIIQVPPVNSGIEVITEASATRAHNEGLIVWAWANDASTQENAEFYQQMLDLGVDGFITGRPELFPTSS